jgi:hypothetical protein
MEAGLRIPEDIGIFGYGFSKKKTIITIDEEFLWRESVKRHSN